MSRHRKKISTGDKRRNFISNENVIKIPGWWKREKRGEILVGDRIILFGVTFSPEKSYDDYRRPLAHDEKSCRG